MQDKAIHFVHELIKYFISLPSSTWYAAGVFVGSTVLASILLEVIKRYHNWKHVENMTKAAMNRLLLLLGGVFSFAGWYVTNAGTFTPNFPPFIASHALQLVGLATLIYNFGASKKYKAFAATVNKWVANKNSLKNQLKPDVPAVEAPQPPEQPKTPTNIAW